MIPVNATTWGFALLFTLNLLLSRASAEEPVRLLILPFENATPEEGDAKLGETIAELLTVLVSHSRQVAIVDRDHLDQVLQELSLVRANLVSSSTRIRIGKLLGATVLVSGSHLQQGESLLITARATDIESARVLVSHEVRGSVATVVDLLSELEERLLGDLERELPDLPPERTDRTPVANLYFLRGLNHYYAGRYNHALAEFLRASREDALRGAARLWMANCYLAQEDYGHAYLELRKITGRFPARGGKKDRVRRKLVLCTLRLSAEEREFYERLLSSDARSRTSSDSR